MGLNGKSRLWMLLVFFVVATTDYCPSAESASVTVRLENYEGPATVRVESFGRFKAKIDVDRKTDRNPLSLAVELPKTGRDTWPFINVEVLDSNGRPVSVRRGGIESREGCPTCATWTPRSSNQAGSKGRIVSARSTARR